MLKSLSKKREQPSSRVHLLLARLDPKLAKKSNHQQHHKLHAHPQQNDRAVKLFENKIAMHRIHRARNSNSSIGKEKTLRPNLRFIIKRLNSLKKKKKVSYFIHLNSAKS